MEALRRTVAARPTRRGPSVGTADETRLDMTSNHEFAFIAGYTEGGAPFGVCWEDIDSDHGLIDERESRDPTDPRAEASVELDFWQDIFPPRDL